MSEIQTVDIETDLYEEQYTEESSSQKIIFDKKLYDKIKNKDFSLGPEIFKKPIKELFKRNKEEFIVISDKETVVDIIPILNKRTITNEVSKLKTKKPIKYVYLAAIEIIVKACFKEGINTPLELYLSDDRIIEPSGKQIIAQFKGNLIYQKVKFIISPSYAISITDKHIEKSYVLYWKLEGIKMKPGSKIITVRCKNAYVLSTKHEIKIRNKLETITIEDSFKELIKPIDKTIKKYEEINDEEEELSIVSKRFNTLKLYNNEVPNYRTSGQYFIELILENKGIIALLDTGANHNYIQKYLVQNKEIRNEENS